MEQTELMLKEALQKLESAINHYEEIVKSLQQETDKDDSIKKLNSLKIRISEKQGTLNPDTKFEDITESALDHSPTIPSGHNVSLYYDKKPYKSAIIYQSSPVLSRPWLSFQLLNS
ncbi:hypothetical protein [Halalkalibacter wakoensis]|nr:hypothetical protein [Halalkalibacter wakoensis]